MRSEVSFVQKKSMRRALIWHSLLSEPLFTVYGLGATLLYKQLGASAFLLSLLMMLKPLVTALSFYWSSHLKQKYHRLKSNVIWAGIWMRLPFLLCPWFDSVGFLIFAFVNYMFFFRASSPAWMEMIKRNLEEGERNRLFSLSSALAYAEGVILSLGIGAMLDHNPLVWKIVFALSAFVGLGSIWFQKDVSVPAEVEKGEKSSFKERIIHPWKDSFALLRKEKDFAKFQWGFMICGFGIMLIQPALTLFAVDTLQINYLEMTVAISVAKGLGFVLSSSWWSKLLNRHHIAYVASLVFLMIGLFPILLGFSVLNMAWFYIAHFFYGIGQGGSHLVWNLSGPTFAKNNQSMRYTGVGVMLAGIRGGIAPPLGGFIASSWGPMGALILGAILCLYSGLDLLRSQKIFVDNKN